MSDDLVRLDTRGQITGTVDNKTAHSDPLVPHLAFSVFVFDPEEGLLLQRRSTEKATFPGLWSNSCCSHPRPGEDLGVTVRRRIREELGIHAEDLVLKGGFWYRALESSGRGEHEYDLVLTCTVGNRELDLDPGEVADVVWVPLTRAREFSEAPLEPGVTPWFQPALEVALGPVQTIAVDIMR